MKTKGKPFVLEDFDDENDFIEKFEKIFKEYTKKQSHEIDRYYLTGISRLSKRKKKIIMKWVHKIMKKELKK